MIPVLMMLACGGGAPADVSAPDTDAHAHHAHHAAEEMPAGPATTASLYDLDLDLATPGGPKELDLHRGHPVLVTMLYSTCTQVCPMVVSKLQAIEARLPAEKKADLRVVVVSLDPERDTPEVLAKFGERHGVDDRWTLAQVPEDQVRELSAALGIRYRQLPDREFNHSVVIALLDENGVIAERIETIGAPDDTVVERLGGR